MPREWAESRARLGWHAGREVGAGSAPRFTKSFTFVVVLPTLMSSPVAEDTAAVYASTSGSIRSDGTGPGITTKPCSCISEAASITL